MKDYKVCPFNARHVVPKPEFDYHLQTCGDRGRFEAEQLKCRARRRREGDGMEGVRERERGGGRRIKEGVSS